MKNLKARKKPAQNRSRGLVDDIIEAGIRILREDGGKGFTTIKVAKRAGVSVGSLYQYFPSKEAILFRIQEKEWAETWSLMESILVDTSQEPRERLRLMIQEFFRTEIEELELRRSLEHAEAECEASSSYQSLEHRSHESLKTFLADLNPGLSDPDFHVDFMMTMISNFGEELSERNLAEKDLELWTETTYKALLKVLLD